MNMKKEFFDVWKESKCDWLTFCGSWMVYDGALFVNREGF
jgi:hypothetical protein